MKEELKTESITVRIDGKRTEVIDNSLIYIPTGKHEIEIELVNQKKFTMKPDSDSPPKNFLERIWIRFTYTFSATLTEVDAEWSGRVVQTPMRIGRSGGNYHLDGAVLRFDGKNVNARIRT